MKTQPALAINVGLRHVIEDGLAILANDHLTDDRRKFVVEDLSDLLGNAYRGSELAKNSSLFVKATDRTAFEAYSLLDRLSGDGSTAIREQLRASAEAFDALKHEKEFSDDQKKRVTQFLKQLLGSLERQDSSLRSKRREISDGASG
jgi:hypothetical protein